MTNTFSNPISGAISAGLGGAACVAIGAAIRDNDVDDEAMTQMVGGVITGAIAGFLGYCYELKSSDQEQTLCSIKSALDIGLSFGALLTAQLMGEEILDRGTTWEDVVVDNLIGGSILAGGACAIGALVCGSVALEYIKEKLSRPARQAQIAAPSLASPRLGTFFPQPQENTTSIEPQTDNSAQNRV